MAKTRTMAQDRIFLDKTVKIAVPAAMQGVLNTVVNLVDNLMIGSVGTLAIASVGLANKVFFVFSLLVFGIVSGAGILTAQYWGKGDVGAVRKTLGLSLILAVGASLLFTVPARLNSRLLMRIFTASEESIRLGGAYLAVAALAYPFTAVTSTYVSVLRAVNRVKEPVAISCMTIILNVVLNYILIYGKFNIPAMGVTGAAAATLISRMAETVAVLCVVYFGKTPLACRIRELAGYSKTMLTQFYETAFPVIANEFIWGTGVTVYSVAYGRMGNNAVAVITIATTIQDIVVVLFQGVSAAAAVILGNELGAGKMKRAQRYAENFFILQFLLTLVTALLCVAVRWKIIGLYQPGISDEVAGNVSRCLLIFAVLLPFRTFNYINIVGVLRSGGDTRMCLIIDTAGVWLIGVPLAFLGALVWELPIYAVYAMVMMEEIFKAAFGYARYRKKVWLKNLNEYSGWSRDTVEA